MTKGRKCKKKRKREKVVAAVGAVMAGKCPGPPGPLTNSHEQCGCISLQFPLPTAISSFFFLCVFLSPPPFSLFF